MNEATTTLRAGPPRPNGDEAQTYMEDAPRVLRIIRQRIIDVDITWQRHRAELVNRYRDDIARLDAQHEKDSSRLCEMATRIERLQEE